LETNLETNLHQKREKIKASKNLKHKEFTGFLAHVNKKDATSF
jgi:hypothetical protein